VPNIIAQGTSIIGDIVSEGDFRIEGSIKGSIIAKGRIVVGTSGNVDGEITCSNADVCGTVTGKLNVTNLTILKSTAIFTGDIITKKYQLNLMLFSQELVKWKLKNQYLKINNLETDNKDNHLKFYAKYSTLALQMIVIIVAGAFGGKALDSWLNWDFPVFTLVLTILSVAGAVFYGMRGLFKNND